jgi:hypothetical protein
MADITVALKDVHEKIAEALKITQGDPKASPVLVAVVQEFANKADKALAASDGRVAVIELEQAGDSAKAAAEADTAVAPETTTAVLDAHMAICILKAGLDQG